ncbi:TPA: 30S ribosomal protein S20 [Candidatus Campbellbacteria bacterium]|uniref:Small ribosomal subunit protein bS20 n=2 Tax=Candidatus Campbelliibacteriota TaxID=1752727 RepID=A0A1F5ELQ9_9BACT|nr:MAG: 30S ribosomal protein S20, small subunit ribosomal protein S20 [Candidatus Campbellbacteria bacterium GW2011_OD1_34_28]KKP75259.1 MAG: 30S ribosomal protein S20 [Candidatus Campbellbacteria bacterium GW2011_GWD2_35_24]KKP76180.1 MAG: 30S ribosomal protein S20, small subunit ribosomal protein S20 [Candidatus Campbellbacteria bacterium GW2011_GWC2_35_28]KKP77369.1 MAG: 30S ribosomal protein S20 [Candidatus Campbellbacteria bacterium GW2011_GWC1_35_31]KKP79298.1 MAG: 30S ribosomal protein 
MPITRSAKKALKGSEKKRVFNLRRKRTMKDSVKEIVKSVSAKEGKNAEVNLSKAFQAIDKAAKRGIIKKNTASRKKSRLSKMVAKVNAK